MFCSIPGEKLKQLMKVLLSTQSCHTKTFRCHISRPCLPPTSNPLSLSLFLSLEWQMGWPTFRRTVLGRPVYAWQDGTDQTTLWKVKSLFIRQHHCVMRGKGGQWQPERLGQIQKVRDPVLCTKRWHRQLAVSIWLIRCCLSYVLNHHSVTLIFQANNFHALELDTKVVLRYATQYFLT